MIAGLKGTGDLVPRPEVAGLDGKVNLRRGIRRFSTL